MDAPLYRRQEVVDWINLNLVKRCDGYDLPSKLSVVSENAAPLPKEIPKALALLHPLFHLPIHRPECSAAVYFLVKCGVVVYVGQGKRFCTRIGEHLHAKDFDSVFYIPLSESQLDAVESAFISTLKPALNINPGAYIGPNTSAAKIVDGFTKTPTPA